MPIINIIPKSSYQAIHILLRSFLELTDQNLPLLFRPKPSNAAVACPPHRRGSYVTVFLLLSLSSIFLSLRAFHFFLNPSPSSGCLPSLYSSIVFSP
jgi:hypothetical protein